MYTTASLTSCEWDVLYRLWLIADHLSRFFRAPGRTSSCMCESTLTKQPAFIRRLIIFASQHRHSWRH